MGVSVYKFLWFVRVVALFVSGGFLSKLLFLLVGWNLASLLLAFTFMLLFVRHGIGLLAVKVLGAGPMWMR